MFDTVHPENLYMPGVSSLLMFQKYILPKIHICTKGGIPHLEVPYYGGDVSLSPCRDLLKVAARKEVQIDSTSSDIFGYARFI